MTKSRSRAKKATRTPRRQRKAGNPARPDPPKVDIPPLEDPVAEAPDHLRAREAAFKRRLGVKR